MAKNEHASTWEGDTGVESHEGRWRKDVQRQVGKLNDQQWRILLEQNPEPDANSSTIVKDLVDTARAIYGRGPRREVAARGMADLNEYERTLSWFAAREVPQMVSHFRTEKLDDRLLDPPDARRWINQMLKQAATLYGGRFRRLALVDESAPVSRYPWDGMAIISVHDPEPGLDWWALMPRLLSEGPEAPDGEDHPVFTLELLRLLSTQMRDLRGWTVSEATLWVLTGVAPVTRLLQGWVHGAIPSSRFGERVELIIDPIVPPREVEALYRRARTQLYPGGARVRPQSPKSLRLARWAEERMASEPWALTLDRWNREYPDDAYRTVNQFTAEVHRAKVRFLSHRPFDRASWNGEHVHAPATQGGGTASG